MNIVKLDNLLAALKDAKAKRLKYDLTDWRYCPYGRYRKYMDIRIPSNQRDVCIYDCRGNCACDKENEKIYKEIQKLFDLTDNQLEHLFDINEGPKTLTEAIARTEELLKEAKGVAKEVSPSLRVRMKKPPVGLKWTDLYKNDTFRYNGSLWVKVSEQKAFNYNDSVLCGSWEFATGMEKTSVEIVEL